MDVQHNEHLLINGDDDLTISIVQRGRAPEEGEFVISRTNTAYTGGYNMVIGNTNLTVASNVPMQISEHNDILVRTRGNYTNFFNVKVGPVAFAGKNKRQIVLVVANSVRLTDYDQGMFRYLHTGKGEQNLALRKGTCNLCYQLFTIKTIHRFSSEHKSQDFRQKFAGRNQNDLLNHVPQGLFFDKQKSKEAVLTVTDKTRTIPLTMFSDLPSNKMWISVVYYHIHQGLELVSLYPVVKSDNQIQYVNISEYVDKPIEKGINTCGISLKVTSDLPMEAPVELIYEIMTADGRKFIRLNLRIKQGITEDFYLEPLEKTRPSRSMDMRTKAGRTWLGTNFLRVPSPHDMVKYDKAILDAMEHTNIHKGRPKFKYDPLDNATQEAQRIEHSKLLHSPLTPANFVEKSTLCIQLETNNSKTRTTAYMIKGIYSMTKIPDCAESRLVFQIRPSNLGRLQIKTGFLVVFNSKGTTFPGFLERVDGNFCSFIVRPPTCAVDLKDDMSLTKMENQFLSFAHMTGLQLAEERDLVDYFFPTHFNLKERPCEPLVFCQTLHTAQQDTVENALVHDTNIPFLISGPAGAGKSLVILEIVLQMLVRKPRQKILLVNPTNHGLVDLHHKLSTLLENYTGNRFKALKIASPSQPRGPTCNHCYLNSAETQHEYPPAEYIKEFSVFLCTPTVALRLGFVEGLQLNFSAIIIDEAAYLTEVETVVSIIPHMPEQKPYPLVVMAGDVVQLTYQPRSSCAKLGGYGISTMKRLSVSKLYSSNPRIFPTLWLSFRNPKTMVDLMNKLAYKGVGEVHTGVTTHIGEIHACHTASATNQADNDTSTYSNVEAAMCLNFAVESRRNDPEMSHVILCCYAAQVAVFKQLQETMFPRGQEGQRFKVLTTETVQGSEADVVLLSPSIGGTYPTGPSNFAWSGNINRLTMCLSRSKHRFYIVGNLLLLNKIASYRMLITKATDMGLLYCHRHIKQLLDIDNRCLDIKKF